MAQYIRKAFVDKYNGVWHCIVGRNFGSYVTHEAKNHVRPPPPAPATHSPCALRQHAAPALTAPNAISSMAAGILLHGADGSLAIQDGLV